MRELSKIRRHMKARTRSGEASERSVLVDFNIMLTIPSASDFDFVKLQQTPPETPVIR